QAQHGGLGDPVPVVAHHGPHLAVPPCRMRQRVPPPGHAHALARRARPRPLDRGPGPGAGLPASPRPLGHADHLAEPRGRHARLDADHLEVLEGPSRPSADFFHTRTSRCAAPRAGVNSAAPASSCCSRVEGPDFPAARPVLPASRNARSQSPTACPDTCARRAAAATGTAPAKTDNAVLVFSSAGTAGGLARNDQTPPRSGPQATGPATKSDARQRDHVLVGARPAQGRAARRGRRARRGAARVPGPLRRHRADGRLLRHLAAGPAALQRRPGGGTRPAGGGVRRPARAARRRPRRGRAAARPSRDARRAASRRPAARPRPARRAPPRGSGGDAMTADPRRRPGAPDRLVITLWDFSWLTRSGAGEPFEDLDAACAQARERGYNTIRICAVPFLLFRSGLDTTALRLEPLGAGTPMADRYWQHVRWYDVAGPTVVDVRARLLALFRAAQRHD